MILTVNIGSSSIKLSLFREENLELIQALQINDSSLSATTLKKLAYKPTKIIHRIVHGGTLTTPCVISPTVEDQIETASKFAPLHNLRALQVIKQTKKVFGNSTLQIAVFDTEFFSQLPPVSRTYAIPQNIAKDHNIFKTGFHGLAHESIWLESKKIFPELKKLISLQLGSGCSAAAIFEGKPLDTSMGFSPLEGLVMSSRPGDLDPGILIHLLKQKIFSLEELEYTLNHKSGLLGLSGLSSNMQKLLESPESQAQFAIEVFCHRLYKYIGAYQALLKGVDGIAFAGGIGFNSPIIREKIISNFEWCGATINQTLNQNSFNHSQEVSDTLSKPKIFAIKVDEEKLMVEKAKVL